MKLPLSVKSSSVKMRETGRYYIFIADGKTEHAQRADTCE